MVLGVGVDIIEIDRIEGSVEKFGDRFLDKVFTPTELEYCMSKKHKFQHLAARFAAKEAVAKALATGWSVSFNWKDIEIYNQSNGMPEARLYGSLKDFLGTDKLLKVTISHSQNYVVAFAIVYTAANMGN